MNVFFLCCNKEKKKLYSRLGAEVGGSTKISIALSLKSCCLCPEELPTGNVTQEAEE